MLMFPLRWKEKTKKDQFILSRNKKDFFNSFPDHIKASGHVPTLITTTGFGHAGFEWILEYFEGLYNRVTGLGRYDYVIHKKDSKKGKPCF
eukprot:8401052-Ditylum_brightwellii.AAC.1